MLYCVSACDDFISTNMGLVWVLVSLSPQLCLYAHKVQFHSALAASSWSLWTSCCWVSLTPTESRQMDLSLAGGWGNIYDFLSLCRGLSHTWGNPLAMVGLGNEECARSGGWQNRSWQSNLFFLCFCLCVAGWLAEPQFCMLWQKRLLKRQAMRGWCSFLWAVNSAEHLSAMESHLGPHCL